MLAAAFLDALPVEERPRWESGDLQTLLERIVEEARAELPDIQLTDTNFMRYLAERAAGASTSWLLDLPPADLYLACACATGSSAAIIELESRYFPAVEGIVRGKLDSTRAAEAMQRVREHLFVGERPHILDYSGRGDLGKWLTITAVRAGLRVVREAKRDTALDDHTLGELVDASDVELAHLRTRYEPEFKQAFADAFAQLEARDRNLLRHSVLDGHGVDRIAELYGIHRSTASRWLAAARADVIKRTKAALRARLQVSPSELESILRVLAEQVDVTLEGILRHTRDEK